MNNTETQQFAKFFIKDLKIKKSNFNKKDYYVEKSDLFTTR